MSPRRRPLTDVLYDRAKAAEAEVERLKSALKVADEGMAEVHASPLIDGSDLPRILAHARGVVRRALDWRRDVPTPVYIREGWRPAGPGHCRCPKCGAIVTTNALGRSMHRCPPQPPQPKAKP